MALANVGPPAIIRSGLDNDSTEQEAGKEVILGRNIEGQGKDSSSAIDAAGILRADLSPPAPADGEIDSCLSGAAAER